MHGAPQTASAFVREAWTRQLFFLSRDKKSSSRLNQVALRDLCSVVRSSPEKPRDRSDGWPVVDSCGAKGPSGPHCGNLI
jgi:hypothetical protein